MLRHFKDNYVETTPELISELEKLQLRPVPNWLGDFKFRMIKRFTENNAFSEFHTVIQCELIKLAALVPDQQFNTVFIQRYEPGQAVHQHRDPRNNIGHTVIGLYGTNWKTHFIHYTRGPTNPDTFIQRPGDVMVVPCTLGGVQGRPHEMYWAEDHQDEMTTRWAIILNTII